MSSANDPSVEFEPQIKGAFKKDTNSIPPDPPLGMNPVVESFSHDSPDDVEFSVWDEPVLNAAQKQLADKHALTYARWLEQRKASFGELKSWVITLLIACLSGPWGLMTLMFYGYGYGVGWGQLVITVLFAPLLQELGKIAFMLWVVEKRPYWFTGWFQIFLCSMVSATCFVVVFNWVGWFTDNAPLGQFFQWTIFFLMHLVASCISAIGLEKIWHEASYQHRRPRMELGYPWFRAAFFINAGFSLAIIVAEWIVLLVDRITPVA